MMVVTQSLLLSSFASTYPFEVAKSLLCSRFDECFMAVIVIVTCWPLHTPAPGRSVSVEVEPGVWADANVTKVFALNIVSSGFGSPVGLVNGVGPPTFVESPDAEESPFAHPRVRAAPHRPIAMRRRTGSDM